MYEEDEQSSSNIIPALKRYKWHLTVAVPLLMLVAVIIVMAIPPVYRSTGYVMVETQQIPTNLVQSTVTNAASEQIEIITQRVMTRDKLASIVEAHSYFGYQEASPVEKNYILYDFRNHVNVEVTRVKSGREKVAIGFSISFDSDSPAVAQAVTSKLVNLFLSENVRARTQRASETTEFLEAEAEKMRVQLEKTEAQVADFKRKYKDSLPEHLNLYVGMREDTRRSLSDINESITALNEQITILQNQLSLSKEQGAVVGTDAQSELSRLRTEYNRLLLQYQPSHPDLVLLKEKIALLEGNSSSGGSDSINSEVQRNIQNQISSLRAKIKFLQEEKVVVSTKLADLDERIIKIPQVEREFTSISRNYETVQEQYQSLQAKAQSAAIAESLEEEQKAERFTLLEPPYLPNQPFKPNRKQLLAAAVAGAIGLPFALVVLLGFLDKSIHSSEALTKVIGAAPLVEIPYIQTEEEVRRARLRIIYGASIALVIVLLGLVITHFTVMHLDVFVSKVIARIGL